MAILTTALSSVVLLSILCLCACTRQQCSKHSSSHDVAVGGGAVCRFGEAAGCMYRCHCEGEAPCDPRTGECRQCKRGISPPYEPPDSTRIVNGWSGPGCQVGNVAGGSQVIHVESDGADDAGWSVDGQLITDLAWCTQINAYLAAQQEDRNIAWWRADLGTQHVVIAVEIVFPANSGQEYSDMMEALYILVGNNPTDKWTSETCDYLEKHRSQGDHPPRSFVYVQCDHLLVGRYIFLIRGSGGQLRHKMTLCEVMVTGYKFEECPCGKFGPGCLRECHCEGKDCDVVTGHCNGQCEAGWKGDNCQESCKDGWWGPGCQYQCQCNIEGELCFKVDGYCPSGCKKGSPGCPEKTTVTAFHVSTNSSKTSTQSNISMITSTTTSSIITTTRLGPTPSVTSSPQSDVLDQQDQSDTENDGPLVVIKESTTDWRLAFIIVSAVLFLVCVVLVMLAAELLCRGRSSNYQNPPTPTPKPEYEKPAPQYQQPGRYQGLQFEEPAYAQLDQTNGGGEGGRGGRERTPVSPPHTSRPSSQISVLSSPESSSYHSPAPLPALPTEGQPCVPLSGALLSQHPSRPVSVNVGRTSYLEVT